MNQWFQSLDVEVFKKWVHSELVKDQELTYKEIEDGFLIYYNNKEAKWNIKEHIIIEETIEEKGRLVFYLNFELYDFRIAIDFYHRMIEKLKEAPKEELNILLSCTGGMTTGFFAEKMNEFVELNQLNYHISAVPFYKIVSLEEDYDLILLAPQLAYKLDEVSELMAPIPVAEIESHAFATYDCVELLKQIEEYI